MELLKPPSLLVASPQMSDEHFQKTVSLLVEHEEHGALAFVINRPSEVPLAAVLEKEEIPRHISTWMGGPVGRSRGLILTTDTSLETEDEDLLFPEFLISSSPDALARLIIHAEQHDPSATILYPYRFLIGHAGWGEGQLDQELLDHSSWLQLPFDAGLVFSTPWPRLWDTAIARLGVRLENFIVDTQRSTSIN